MRPQFTQKDIERFWSKVDRSGGPDACWPFTRGLDGDGYGQFHVCRKPVRAHQIAFAIANGHYATPCTLHTCHFSTCCNPAHLYEGTNAQNSRDMVEAGHSTKGDRNWARRHPELMPRGDNNGARKHPELMPRGDRNGARLHPERLPRGEGHGNARLTEPNVREIRAKYALSVVSLADLAVEYGVTKQAIHGVVSGKRWAHVV
jgi:hypothetical protein